MGEKTRIRIEGGVAWITLDDGKVNALSSEMIGEIGAALDAAEGAAAVTVLSGREGIFSAGFDLKTFQHGPEAGAQMVRAGAELVARLLAFPLPVLTVCAGHAYPAGAFLMLAADVRLGAAGPWRIGMNEVAIGLTLPKFAVELARHRLTPPGFVRITTAAMFAPEEAHAPRLPRPRPPRRRARCRRPGGGRAAPRPRHAELRGDEGAHQRARARARCVRPSRPSDHRSPRPGRGAAAVLVLACAAAPGAGDPATRRFDHPEHVTLLGYDGHAMEPFLARDGRYLLLQRSERSVRRHESPPRGARRRPDVPYEGELKGVNTPALEGVATMDRHGTLYFVSPRSYAETSSTLYRGHFVEGEVSASSSCPVSRGKRRAS